MSTQVSKAYRHVARYTHLTWLVVRAADVQVGDEYANHGQVTSVISGPWKSPAAEEWWPVIRAGETAFQVGPGLGSLGSSDRAVIVGRDFSGAAS